MALSSHHSCVGGEVSFVTGKTAPVVSSSCKCTYLNCQLSFWGSSECPRTVLLHQHPRRFDKRKALSSSALGLRSCVWTFGMCGLSFSQILGSEFGGISRYSLPYIEKSGLMLSMKSVGDVCLGAPCDDCPSVHPSRARLGQGSPLGNCLLTVRDPLQMQRRKRSCQSIRCVGASAGAALATAKPFLDQILLLGTVVGVYIAGISSAPRLPQRSADGRLSSAHPALKRKESETKEPTRQFPEYVLEGDDWARLQSKLSRVLSRSSTELAAAEITKSPILALQAIAQVPRLRLLLTTLQHIHKEVKAISDEDQRVDSSRWQDLSLNVLSRSVPWICSDWLLEGSGHTGQPPDGAQWKLASTAQHPTGFPDFPAISGNLQNADREGEYAIPSSTEMDVLDNMMQNLKESESVPSYIGRSGKEGLYADLMFFLRFKTFRRNGCCDERVITKRSGHVLEDMVVAVAEVVASLFLDCASSGDLDPYGDMWQTFLSPFILSTRSLERFRNEVALYGWLNQNFTSVTAMFEDRFDLWTIQMKRISSEEKKHQKPLSNEAAVLETGGKGGDLVLTRAQLPAKRGTELKALKGWKYSYSIFLELSDVVGPLLRLLFKKLGEGISFLLIILIERSLGLIYQGIRQSLRWPSNRKNDGWQ